MSEFNLRQPRFDQSAYLPFIKHRENIVKEFKNLENR